MGQIPECRVKEQLGILIAALVMSPALTVPQSHCDILRTALGRHPVPHLLQSPCHPQLG